MPDKKIRRKAYTRKAYTRKSGVRVRSTKVAARLIKKQGLTTGKKGLISLKDYRHLSTFGYSFSKAASKRHVSLKKAAEKYGRTWTIRRLNALANLRPKLPKYASLVKKARNDIKYLQKKVKRSYKPE